MRPIRTSQRPRPAMSSVMRLADLAVAAAMPAPATPSEAASRAWPSDAMNSLSVGEAMHRLARELYPLRRSLTGDGFRETIRRVGELIPVTVTEMPTGTQVFDWTVPQEWNIREAWVANAQGERVIDLENSTLHVVQYSVPVRQRMSLAALARRAARWRIRRLHRQHPRARQPDVCRV